MESDNAPAPRSPLLTRGFLMIMAAGMFYFLANGVVIPVLPHFIVRSLKGNNFTVGLVIGAFALSAVIARPTAGRLGNHHGRRALMVWGAALVGVSILLYGLAPNVATLTGFRLITGIGEGLFFTGSATLVADLSPPDRRGEALSYFSITTYLGSGLGPVIGQTVSNAIGPAWTFVVAGSLGLVATLLSVWAPDPRVMVPATAQHARLLNAKAVGPGAVMALGVMGVTAFQAYVPLYADQLHLGGSQYVFLLYSAVVLTIRTIGARIPDRLGAPRAAALAIAVNAAGLAVIATVGTGVGLYIGTAVFAVGGSLLYPSLMTMAVNAADEHERSSVVGSFTAFFDLGQGASGFGLGAVSAVAGYRAAFGSSAAFALLGLVVLRRRVARTPALQHHPTADILSEPDAWVPPAFE